MKKDLLKVSVLLLGFLFLNQTYASEDCCECYDAEEKVYIDETSKKESQTEFSENQKMEIQIATSLIAEG